MRNESRQIGGREAPGRFNCFLQENEWSLSYRMTNQHLRHMDFSRFVTNARLGVLVSHEVLKKPPDVPKSPKSWEKDPKGPKKV